MARIKVSIEKDQEGNYSIIKDFTAKTIINDFSQLCYGDTAAASAGTGDDLVESAKTIAGTSPLVGWVTVQ